MELSFTKHPESVGETYGEHFASASYFGLRMIGAGVLCLIHGLLPFLFTTNGSRTIIHLHERMVTNRHRQQGQKINAASANAAN